MKVNHFVVVVSKPITWHVELQDDKYTLRKNPYRWNPMMLESVIRHNAHILHTYSLGSDDNASYVLQLLIISFPCLSESLQHQDNAIAC